MIQVILLSLKIIGITVLSLLGLLLLVLALVLFVPIFYRVRIVHNKEKTQVNAKASFLFPLFVVSCQYLKKFTYRIRVVGFSVLDSEKPKKEKKEKKSQKAKKEKVKKKKAGKRSEKDSASEQPAGTEMIPEQVKPQETENRPPVAETAEPKQENEPEQKTGFFKKLSLKLKKIRETISNIINKIKKLLHQKEEIQRILKEPSTKRALAFVWEEAKHLLKHVLPRKIKGYVAYGADNPATTGQVLGVLSVVYARTGALLEIHPNFEEKQFECDMELRGHVQVFTLLVIAVKVFLHQELRQMITEFKNVKEIE